MDIAMPLVVWYVLAALAYVGLDHFFSAIIKVSYKDRAVPGKEAETKLHQASTEELGRVYIKPFSQDKS